MEKERVTLAVLGALALVALGVLMWQQQQPPFMVHEQPTPVQTTQWEASLATARQVDLNTADVAELERLPGVGPMLAQRIADDRTAHGRFLTPEDLTRVPGIGRKTYDALRDYVTVRE